jgi:hypothetical protein
VNLTALSTVKSTQYPLNKGLDMPQNQSGQFWENHLPLLKIEPVFLGMFIPLEWSLYELFTFFEVMVRRTLFP